MNRRTRLAISIASGVAAAVMVFAYVSAVRAEAAAVQEEALARYGDDLVSVCVATHDIEPGDTIDEGNVQVEEWLASLLPDDAITSLDEVVGKTATTRIPGNSVLSSIHFIQDGEGVEVPEGKVAVSVACDDEHAVGGALEQGEQVNVYVSKDGISDLLTSAQVLDTNALADGGGELEWVTLAVDASAVEELLAATTRGTITLVIPGLGVDLDMASSDEAEGLASDEAAGTDETTEGDESQEDETSDGGQDDAVQEEDQAEERGA